MDEQSIFSAALEIEDSAEREAYLEEICGDDSDLRARIQTLLRNQPQVGSFMAEPAAPGVAPTRDLGALTEAPGIQIGPYKLLQQIGEGGMGVVYMAEQTEPVERRVALKIIKPGMDSRQVIARFEAEEQALAMMDHPNIAKVLDAGTTDSGRPYFVMELVKGLPITDYCDQQHLTPRERLELFVPVCQAVQHAHQKGIIHRDLKPSNILIALYDDRPVPKVIDFGVAKAITQKLTEKTMFTRYGQLVGTLDYMSPEQANLNQLDIDTRSDVYSLGVLLYELLTGATPFDRQRLRSAAFDEVMRIIREEEPPRPSLRLSTLDTLPSVAANRHTEPKKLSTLVRGELDWIAMKALEKDRRRRYETANGLANDVERYLHDEAVVACPPSAGYRFRKFARRNRATLSTAVVVVAALVVGIVGTTWQAVRASREQRCAELARQEEAGQRAKAERQRGLALKAERRAEEQAAIAEQQRDLAEEQRDFAEENLYLADMRLARQDLTDGQTVRLHRRLDRYVPQSDMRDYRGWEWYYLLSRCHLNDHTLMHRDEVHKVSWSPEGRRLAAALEDGTVVLWNTDTGETIRTLRHSGETKRAVWSPNGEQLATASNDGTIKTWDATTGEELHHLDAHEGGVRGLQFSPDGRWLASGGGDDLVKIWDLGTWQIVQKLAGHDSNRETRHPLIGIQCVAWSPDGARLASAAYDCSVRIWDRETGQQVLDFRGHEAPVVAVAASPDGELFASSDDKGTILLWKATSGEVSHSLRAHAGTVFDLAFSPDGQTLASVGADQAVRLWEAQSGRNVRTLLGHRTMVTGVAFSPDGTLLASASRDHTAKIWNLRALDRKVVISAHRPGPVTIAWAPRGRHLATASENDSTVKIWDPIQFKELLALPDHQGGVTDIAWSPSGELLAAEDSAASSVKIWDVKTGTQVRDLNVGGQRRQLDFSPDGRHLISGGGNGMLMIWDCQTWKPIQTLPTVEGRSATFDPSGRYLAAPSLVSGFRILTTDTWTELRESVTHSLGPKGQPVYGPRKYVDFSWSPKGESFAYTISSRKKVNVFYRSPEVTVGSLGDPKAAFWLRGHTGSIYSVAWNPKGDRLVTTSSDCTMRLWHGVSGKEVLTLKGHNSTVTSAAWSPDGRLLASADEAGRIRIWDARAGYDYASSDLYLRERAIQLWAEGELNGVIPH